MDRLPLTLVSPYTSIKREEDSGSRPRSHFSYVHTPFPPPTRHHPPRPRRTQSMGPEYIQIGYELLRAARSCSELLGAARCCSQPHLLAQAVIFRRLYWDLNNIRRRQMLEALRLRVYIGGSEGGTIWLPPPGGDQGTGQTKTSD